MKTPPEDHDLIRWLDGEMDVAERTAFERRLESDAALRAEAQELQRLSGVLRAHLPTEMPVPYADFFNSQIQMRIAQEDPLPLPAPKHAGWFDWLRLPTVAVASAAVVMAGVMIWLAPDRASSLVLSTYVPNPAVQARSFHSAEAEATVLMLDGVEALPPDRKVVGYRIERSETETEVAVTTLFDKHDQILAVIAKDARNQPRLLARE